MALATGFFHLGIPMPTAAARPCRHTGCGALVNDGSGYCAAHVDDRKIGRFADSNRGSRHERGYGSEWVKIRRQVLSRDKGLCQVCLAAGRYRPAKAVDHVVSKSAGGSDDERNLQSICDPCHKAKTAAESAEARRR
jgi:5-methylcytosine-specific restriction protein A